MKGESEKERESVWERDVFVVCAYDREKTETVKLVMQMEETDGRQFVDAPIIEGNIIFDIIHHV